MITSNFGKGNHFRRIEYIEKAKEIAGSFDDDVINEKVQNLIQADYDADVENAQLHQLTCPCCGQAACFSRNGSYKRRIHTKSGYFVLRVKRVICTKCKHTHAILPSWVVPYKQMPVDDILDIVTESENGGHPYSCHEKKGDVDSDTVRSVIRQFRRFWKARLRAIKVALDDIDTLIASCFKHYSMQFMQIRCTKNSLQLIST